MNFRIVALVSFLLPVTLFAQKIKEGSTPLVKLYLLQGDTAVDIPYLRKNEDNRIRVVVGGGMEQVKHIIIVTSKDAAVKSIPDFKNEFIVRPETNNSCEIIVDVKTFESYQDVKMVDAGGGKKIKQIIKKYPPKTYMIGYEKYKVR
jgi:uncharacterized protein YkvS